MKKIQISKRMNGVSESATLKLNALAVSLKQKGEDIINLTAGEPDFSVHETVQNSAIQAIQLGFSKYTPAAGNKELREKIAQKYNFEWGGSDWQFENVVITNGAKQALFNALQVLVSPQSEQDEVIFGSPYWLSYPEMVKLAGGKSVIIPTDYSDSYRITPKKLQASITPNTRVILFNSPSNPTGGIYSEKHYQEIGEVIDSALVHFPELQEKLVILSDEIYDKIVYQPNRFCSFLKACPQFKNRTITVNGLSKSAALTGWRLGWALAPTEIASAIATYQGQCTSGVNSVMQKAAMVALHLPNEYYSKNLDIYSERRKAALGILNELVSNPVGSGTEKTQSRVKIFSPEGAFYVWIELDQNADSFSEQLLSQKGVVVVPGTSFGNSNAFRMSFATDLKTLEQGCRRIVEFIKLKN